MSASDRRRSLHALTLGALHGPAELMPISSSGHVTLVPWLLGWEEPGADPELRKAFEVALHAGAAAGLVLGLRAELTDAVRAMTPARAAQIAVSALPAALAGYTLQGPIERRLGTPATIAAGLIAGSLVMAWADRSPQARGAQDAGMADALWLGLAQACALVPGVSRNGATLAAARWRRFHRADAGRLSRQVALPVIGGATLLQLRQIARRGLAPGSGAPFALGAAASFLSTLAGTWLMGRLERDNPFGSRGSPSGSRGRALTPYAAYRLALAAVVLRRVARGGRRSENPSGWSA